MKRIGDRVSDVAHRTGFSGVVRVDRAGVVELEKAYGYADRRHRMPNTVTTQFATASATKGLTALAIVSLIEGEIAELLEAEG